MYIEKELTSLDGLLADIKYLRDAKQLLDNLLEHYDQSLGSFIFPTDVEWEKQVKRYRTKGANSNFQHPCEKLQEQIEDYYNRKYIEQ